MQSSVDIQGLRLPADPAPTTSVCYQVNVPNDPAHISAFFSALYDLTLWNSWQRDAAHTGTLAAQTWKKIWTDLNEGGPNCSMLDLRLDPLDSCTIQKSEDGGVTWTDLFSMYDCAYGAGLQAVKDQQGPGGSGPGPGQPGAGGAGTPGQCYDWDVELLGGGQWLCPMPVEPDDTVVISGANGGWFDGAGIFSYWNCPDGNKYIAGGCALAGTTESGDPAPTLQHMRLIARVVGQTSGEWIDAYNATITIGAGSTGDFRLQPNDSVLNDNAGSIKFHVQLCKGGWCHLSSAATDFATWLFAHYGHFNGTSLVDDSGHIDAYLDLPGAAHLTDVKCHISSSSPYYLSVRLWTGAGRTGTLLHSEDTTYLGGGSVSNALVHFHGDWSGVNCISIEYIAGGQSFSCSDVQFSGVLPNPFGSNNC